MNCVFRRTQPPFHDAIVTHARMQIKKKVEFMAQTTASAKQQIYILLHIRHLPKQNRKNPPNTWFEGISVFSCSQRNINALDDHGGNQADHNARDHAAEDQKRQVVFQHVRLQQKAGHGDLPHIVQHAARNADGHM